MYSSSYIEYKLIGSELRVRKRFIISAINSILQDKDNCVFPIYQAITYEDIQLTGGTTKPVVFTVDVEGTLTPFVVKVFKKKDIQQYNPTAKECLAHALAAEFDLPQPEVAIIKFDEAVLANIPEEVAQRVKDSGQHYHFGTQYMEGYSIFNQTYGLQDLDHFEIANLFAFDIFIFNTDRRRGKPNLLVKGSDYLLIDHDLSLPIFDTFLDKARKGDFSYLYGNERLHQHLLLPYLKKQAKKGNLDFGTFEYFLETLNVHPLDRVDELLQGIECSDKNFGIIKSYICELKEQRGAFIKSLKNFLLK